MKAKRDEVNERILDKQEEKLKIQNDLHALTERLARVTDDLGKMVRERDDYERECRVPIAAVATIALRDVASTPLFCN